MLKHKLFIPDEWSPLNLSKAEDLLPKASCNQSVKLGILSTSEQGSKLKHIMTTPVAKKKKLEFTESGNSHHSELLSHPGTSEPGTSKNTNDENASDSALSSVSDNDSDAIQAQFFANNQKLPYTYQEDEMILKFVLKDQNIFRVSSISLWKFLEAKKNKPKRTYQSLKNRFLRNIKPHIFTSYKHLIDNEDTVEKILIKFPELKMQLKGKKFSCETKEFKPEKRAFEKSPMLNSNLNKCEINTEKREKVALPFAENKSENFSQSILASSISPSSKSYNVERIVTLHKNVIKISINLNKCEVPYAPLQGLSERFEKLKKNNERIPCPTCGRFYRRPVSNNSSESGGEGDIPNSFSVEIDENPEIKNITLISNKSPANISRKISLRSWSSRKSSNSQNLLSSLEKSDKSDGNSEESNSLPEEVTEKDDIEKIVEVLEAPVKEQNSKKEDKTTENDSDVDLIYEHTAEKFQNLIDADEEKTLQRKCLNKNRDTIGLSANAEKNLDSFFLETPLEVEIPTVTPQVQVNSTRTESQRITRSSVLASNMMKMMVDKTANKRKFRK